MTDLIIYLVQVSGVFSALYLLYILFLSKLTFHNSNRLVLLLLLPVSVLIPFSEDLFPSIASKMIEVPLFEQLSFKTIDQQLQAGEQHSLKDSYNYVALLTIVYWLIFAIYGIRLLMTIKKLFAIRSKATIQQKDGYQLVFANVPEIFSYFNWMFIPRHKSEDYDPKVLEHEKVHIQLKHSWDIILSEVYIAFFWFNPLLYFYRRSLRSVHEFQADKAVLKNGVKTSQYMQLLLQSLEVQKPNTLYNYFNQPILKKRITMMTKPKSNPLAKLVYILLLPACILLISAFTSPITKTDLFLNTSAISKSVSSPPSLFPVQYATIDNITATFGEEGKHPEATKGIIHTGIDIKAKPGTPVLATADGVVAKASMEGNWGNLVVITHADGYETWYAHLEGFNTNENQAVRKGDIIGYLGNTGKSTGPHLHYELKQNGKHLNPMDYLK